MLKAVDSNLAEVNGIFQDIKVLCVGGTLSCGSQIFRFSHVIDKKNDFDPSLDIYISYLSFHLAKI